MDKSELQIYVFGMCSAYLKSYDCTYSEGIEYAEKDACKYSHQNVTIIT